MSSLLNGSKQSGQTFSIANLLGNKIEAKEERQEENVTTVHGKKNSSKTEINTQVAKLCICIKEIFKFGTNFFSETEFCDDGDEDEDPDEDDDDDDEVVDDVDEDVTDRVPGSSEFFHFPPPPTLLVRPTPGL